MTFGKDPDNVMDYGFDWEPWLDGDTIATSVWVLDPGITKDSDSFTTIRSTIWLSGGTVDTEYDLRNRITTAAGRTKDQSFIVAVVQDGAL